MIKVTVDKDRPDFRVFIDLLYGPDRNVDTDGDSIPIYSRDWEYLSIEDRETESVPVEIFSEGRYPLVFEVMSESRELEEISALYLYLYCGCHIEIESTSATEGLIQSLKIKYAIELERARNSIWHSSSESNPYPNLA
ncbi:hypothetical protein HXX02_00095 [Microbulbifer elongatus]|uniref:Uncharacterized protein n=1 Tax=Microbulbifer elongatus TaxID=86173 RepID=A0ABT1NVA7_9GAMM|nr:hypothetical protein [Microbulbifer elongatus]MCQ3827835.1 hypothetical protein [Microbulbifer elongatus]